MCGIAGICRLDGQPLNEDARAHVRAMTDVITYRGPDGSGIWQEGPVCLGHRRLSIIDLSGGSQPMQDVDGELCIVFNGEIYNFAVLRQERPLPQQPFRHGGHPPGLPRLGHGLPPALRRHVRLRPLGRPPPPSVLRP